VLCLSVYTRFQAPAFCLYALRCDLRSRCRDAHLNRGLAPEGEILFATKTLPGFRPAGQPHGCSNSLQANLCSASAIAPALLYLLHPCSRKESIQKKGGPLPLLSCAPRFHRALPEGHPWPSGNARPPCRAPTGRVTRHPPCASPFGCYACKSAVLPICPGESSGARRGKRDSVRAIASLYYSTDIV